jgi:hypothetical protein
MIKLVAPGYGGSPYGNGALYVSKRAFEFSQQPQICFDMRNQE